MTASDARTHLERLHDERRLAVASGLGDNALFRTDLERDIAASRASYVGLAVTEIASLRGQISGRQVG